MSADRLIRSCVTLYRRAVTDVLFHGLYCLDFGAMLKILTHDRISIAMNTGKSNNRRDRDTHMDEFPTEPPDDVPDEHRDRARELQLQLLVLDAQLESANFENKAAYRRKINEKREELEQLRRR